MHETKEENKKKLFKNLINMKSQILSKNLWFIKILQHLQCKKNLSSSTVSSLFPYAFKNKPSKIQKQGEQGFAS